MDTAGESWRLNRGDGFWKKFVAGVYSISPTPSYAVADSVKSVERRGDQNTSQTLCLVHVSDCAKPPSLMSDEIAAACMGRFKSGAVATFPYSNATSHAKMNL